MEDQIGTVLHWSNQKKPKQGKRKDEVIRRNLNGIHISVATPLPSNPSIGFGVMLRTKNADGRTEGRTEGRRDNEAQTYSPPTGGVGD